MLNVFVKVTVRNSCDRFAFKWSNDRLHIFRWGQENETNEQEMKKKHANKFGKSLLANQNMFAFVHKCAPCVTSCYWILREAKKQAAINIIYTNLWLFLSACAHYLMRIMKCRDGCRYQPLFRLSIIAKTLNTTRFMQFPIQSHSGE